MEVEIQDMYLAALLLAYGFEYNGVDKSDPRRQKFYFNDGEHSVFVVDDENASSEYMFIRDVEKAYIEKVILFPSDYAEALKKIKYIIHKEDNGQEFKRRSGNLPLQHNSKAHPIG